MALELLLPYDRDTPDFVHGFECGRIWAELRADATKQSFPVHTENAEMMLSIGHAEGRAVSAEIVDNDWMIVTFDYPGTADGE